MASSRIQDECIIPCQNKLINCSPKTQREDPNNQYRWITVVVCIQLYSTGEHLVKMTLSGYNLAFDVYPFLMTFRFKSWKVVDYNCTIWYKLLRHKARIKVLMFYSSITVFEATSLLSVTRLLFETSDHILLTEFQYKFNWEL